MSRNYIQNRALVPKINEYMFNKKESIIVIPSEQNFSSQYEQIELIAALYGNLHELGYEIDNVKPLFDLTKEALVNEVYKPLLKAAKEAKGADVEHRLLFPNFPNSVRAVNIDTLSNIRFASYFSTAFDVYFENDALADGSITRSFINEIMDKAVQDANMTKEQADKMLMNEKNQIDNTRVIRIVNDDEFFNMIKNMLSARASLSPYDREIVEFAIDNFDKELYMPDKIQFKETQAFIDKYNFEKRYFENIDVKSFNDFKRLLIILSDGDISSSENQKIKNFGNQDRLALYDIFKQAIDENYSIMLESFATRKNINFANAVLEGRLHFNTIKADSSYTAFMKNVEKHRTVMSVYEQNLQEGKYKVAASILEHHSPTLLIQHAKNILARAYDKYEKTKSDKYKKEVNDILHIVKECSKRTDIKTNLSLIKAAEQAYQPYKIMIAKGKKTNVVVKENKGLQFPEKLLEATRKAIHRGIDFQLSNYEMGGKINIKKGTKVYIDPNLTDCPIPTVGRSDSGKNRTVATGTKLPVEKCDILRAALYKQNDHNQFIDFSAGFFDENYNMVGQVSWNNLKEGKNGRTISYHSGDTSYCSGKGCTEVIDIDLNSVKENLPDARYVAYMAVMWDGTQISSCNKLFMTLSPTNEIGKNQNGETIKRGDGFDPSLVQFKVDVVGDTRASIPMLYDLKEQKAIIVNVESRSHDISSATCNKRHFDLPAGCECLENYHSDTAMKLFAYENLSLPTIHDLASLYVLYKNAELIEDPNKADVIFTTDRIQVEDKREVVDNIENSEQVVITPFDKDVIAAELIPDPKTISCEIKEREIVISCDEKNMEIEEPEL